MKLQPIKYWQYEENKPIPDWLNEHRAFKSPNLIRKDRGVYHEAADKYWIA